MERSNREVRIIDREGNSATGWVFALAVTAVFALGVLYFLSATGTLAGIG